MWLHDGTRFTLEISIMFGVVASDCLSVRLLGRRQYRWATYVTLALKPLHLASAGSGNLRHGADAAFPFWIHILPISLNLNWIVA